MDRRFEINEALAGQRAFVRTSVRSRFEERRAPAGQAFTRFFLLGSILATPAEGAKMLVRPSSQRMR